MKHTLKLKEKFRYTFMSTNIQMFVNTDSQRGAAFLQRIKKKCRIKKKT